MYIGYQFESGEHFYWKVNEKLFCHSYTNGEQTKDSINLRWMCEQFDVNSFQNYSWFKMLLFYLNCKNR